MTIVTESHSVPLSHLTHSVPHPREENVIVAFNNRLKKDLMTLIWNYYKELVYETKQIRYFISTIHISPSHLLTRLANLSLIACAITITREVAASSVVAGTVILAWHWQARIHFYREKTLKIHLTFNVKQSKILSNTLDITLWETLGICFLLMYLKNTEIHVLINIVSCHVVTRDS